MTPTTTTGQMTEAEVWMLTEHLRAVTLCAKKCDRYANMTQDNEIQRIAHAGRDACRDHANRIQTMLQRGGVPVPTLPG